MPQIATSNDQFGYSVSVSGDTVAVGAYLDDAADADTGSAYVFSRDGGEWNQQAKLTAADATSNDQFGYSVSVSGDVVVAGSYLDDVADEGQILVNAGSAYVFTFDQQSWFQQDQVFAFDEVAPQALAGFGNFVAVDGDTMVVGAGSEDLAEDLVDAGAAYGL